MEPHLTQHDSMSMWYALVQVASQRYEELLEEANRQKERKKQEAAMMLSGQSEANQQQATDQSSAFVRSGENVTVGNDGDEECEEDSGRLVIDENAVEVSIAEAEVHQVVPSTNGTQETEQCIQQQRETVIQCRSNGVNSAAVPNQECRTPEQQAVRNKNTIAARQSRAKMRMLEEMLQQEANNEKTHNHYMKERVSGLMTYVNVLRDKIGLEKTDLVEEYERIKQEFVPGPLRAHYVRNRAHSEQENGETSRSGTNGQAADHAESDVTLHENSIDIANGSGTDSAPEPDDTVLDLSVRSNRDSSFGNGVF